MTYALAVEQFFRLIFEGNLAVKKKKLCFERLPVLYSVLTTTASPPVNCTVTAGVSVSFSSSFNPALSKPVLAACGKVAGSAVRVGVEQYKTKPTMMITKDRI